MTSAAAEAYLRTTRLGFLSHPGDGAGWSRPVPVWFDWRDGAARVFSGADAPKVARLRQDPRAHLLVANQVGEPEAWVSLTSTVELGPLDPGWLEALAARYWDLGDPAHRAEVDSWLRQLDRFVLLTMHPTRVRTYGL